MICLRCAEQISDNAKFCTKCGFRLPDKPAAPQPRGPVGYAGAQNPYGQPRSPQQLARAQSAAAPRPQANAPGKAAPPGPSEEQALRGLLQRTANTSLLFGGISILLGITGMATSGLNIVLAAIGLFMIVQALYFQANPSAEGIRYDGIVFLVLGGWNILVSLLNMAAGHGASTIFILVAAYQLNIGLKRMNLYKSFLKEKQ